MEVVFQVEVVEAVCMLLACKMSPWVVLACMLLAYMVSPWVFLVCMEETEPVYRMPV